jgi:hypothetical protein
MGELRLKSTRRGWDRAFGSDLLLHIVCPIERFALKEVGRSSVLYNAFIL